MRTKEALVGMVSDARGWLRTWTADFHESEARKSGRCPAHPVAWQLAHVACTQDDVIRLFPGEKGVVPESLRRLCGSGSPKPTAKTRYPRLDLLRRLLSRTQKRLLTLLRTTPEKALGKPLPEEHPFFKSLGQAAYEISLHEMYHVGM